MSDDLPRMARAEYEVAVPELRTALLRAQEDLAERDFAVVVLLDGPDLTGGDEVFEVLHEWLDARFMRSEAFAPPSDLELTYPALWRYWDKLPPRGTLALVRRSWTASLIVRRTFGELDDDQLETRLGHIQQLERQLAADGVLLVKFWLHVDEPVLKKRLAKARKRNRYAFRHEEWAIAKVYDEGREVARRTLAETEADHAPWHVLRGEDRRRRNLEVGRVLLQALRGRLREVGTPMATRAALPPLARKHVPLSKRPALVAGPEREEDYDEQRRDLQERIERLHRKAERKGVGTIIAFEGWDAAGKGGAIRRLTRALDAHLYKIFAIAAPDAREKSRPWLWRFWRRLPAAGRISIFDRTWYGRVLVERVEGFATEAEWRRAYAEIVDFETQLVEHGYVVVKVFLHISDAEQLRRFEARKQISWKRHKLTDEDWRNRKKRDVYEAAIDEMVARTARPVPWHVVAADDKRHARLAVLRAVADALDARL